VSLTGTWIRRNLTGAHTWLSRCLLTRGREDALSSVEYAGTYGSYRQPLPLLGTGRALAAGAGPGPRRAGRGAEQERAAAADPLTLLEAGGARTAGVAGDGVGGGAYPGRRAEQEGAVALPSFRVVVLKAPARPRRYKGATRWPPGLGPMETPPAAASARRGETRRGERGRRGLGGGAWGGFRLCPTPAEGRADGVPRLAGPQDPCNLAQVRRDRGGGGRERAGLGPGQSRVTGARQPTRIFQQLFSSVGHPGNLASWGPGVRPLGPARPGPGR
jgi:hypothetical protein